MGVFEGNETIGIDEYQQGTDGHDVQMSLNKNCQVFFNFARYCASLWSSESPFGAGSPVDAVGNCLVIRSQLVLKLFLTQD